MTIKIQGSAEYSGTVASRRFSKTTQVVSIPTTQTFNTTKDTPEILDISCSNVFGSIFVRLPEESSVPTGWQITVIVPIDSTSTVYIRDFLGSEITTITYGGSAVFTKQPNATGVLVWPFQTLSRGLLDRLLINSVQFNFGVTPAQEMTFTITDTAIKADQMYQISLNTSQDTPFKTKEEIQMETFHCFTVNVLDGSMEVTVRSLQGDVQGAFVFDWRSVGIQSNVIYPT